jgi:hypothetical protein
LQISELFISDRHRSLECKMNYCDQLILCTRLEEGVFNIGERDIDLDTLGWKVLDSIHVQGKVANRLTAFDVWLDYYIF